MTAIHRRDLSGQTALITGGSKGIGKAIALSLAEEGVNSVLFARTESDLRSAEAEIRAKSKATGKMKGKGVRVVSFAGDASEPRDVEALALMLKDEGIEIDILVHNAGIGQYGPFKSFSVADYDRLMDTNMRSTFLFSKEWIPPMLQRGSGDVIFVASVSGLNGRPGRAIYCASKCAQVAFAESLDYECRPKNVRVTVLAPGGVRTDFAMGQGRKPGMPALEEMMTSTEFAESVRYAVTQPPHMRVFLAGMRHLGENLHQ